jgi:hypothetical protein
MKYYLLLALLVVSCAPRPDTFLTDKCAIAAGLDCIEKPVVDEAAQAIMIKVANNVGETITVTGYEAIDGDCIASEESDIEIPNGESAVVVYHPGQAFKAGERVSCSFNIRYRVAGTARMIPAQVVAKAT